MCIYSRKIIMRYMLLIYVLIVSSKNYLDTIAKMAALQKECKEKKESGKWEWKDPGIGEQFGMGFCAGWTKKVEGEG